MAEYKVIFRADIDNPDSQHGITWEQGCPLMFEAIQISRDTESGKAFLQTKARNLSSTVVSSFKTKLVCHYKDNDTEEFDIEPLDADIAACSEYTLKPMALSKGDVVYAEAVVLSVNMQGKEWKSSKDAEPLPKRKQLTLSKEALAERTLLLQERGCRKPSEAAAYSCVEYDGWVQCSCEQVSMGCDACPSCGLRFDRIKEIENEEPLISIRSARIERKRTEEEAAHQRKREAKARIKKYLPRVVAPLVAVAVFALIGTTLFNALTTGKAGEVHNAIGAGFDFTVATKSNGEALFVGNSGSASKKAPIDVSDWKDIKEVSAGTDFIAGLKSNGTVVVSGNNEFQTAASDWSDIASIATSGSALLGLKYDGTVIGTGYAWDKLSDIHRWSDIVAISVGYDSAAGLRKDGTVVAAWGESSQGCDMSNWTDIIEVSMGTAYAVGLKSDGTVVATGKNKYGELNVSDWTNIVSVSAGNTTTVGIKADGTVVATGDFDSAEMSEMSKWEDVVAVSAGVHHTIALKSDGTLLATGMDSDEQCSGASKWKDIRLSK